MDLLRERWHDYPDWTEGSVIQITPKVGCDRIRYAHRVGWAPEDMSANMTLKVGNSALPGDSSNKGSDA